MANSNTRRPQKAANDNLSLVKRALLEWSERDHGIRGNAKSFLRLLASHARPDASVWIRRRYFGRILGVSVRSITTYTGLLQTEGLMIKFATDVSAQGAAVDVYRLAPMSRSIQALASGEPLPNGKEDRCSSSTGGGNSFTAYREDTTDLNFKEETEAPNCVDSALSPSSLGPIPAKIRRAFATVLSPDQMYSYIDSSTWDEETSTIYTKSVVGAGRLSANDCGLAKHLNINIAARANSGRHG
jgi:hypothetical protein